MNYTLDFNDIELVPEKHTLDNEIDINLKTLITERYGLNIPLIYPPDTNIDPYEMALEMAKLGGVGCIHSSMKIKEQVDIVKKLSYTIYGDGFGGFIAEDWGIFDDDWHSELAYVPIMCEVELGEMGKKRAKELTEAGCHIILIRSLSGYHKSVIDMIRWCRENLDPKVDIVVGEFTNEAGMIETISEGVNGLLVGCSNSKGNNPAINVGFVSSNITNLEKLDSITNIPIISVGKMNSISNIAKALAVGANSVILDDLNLEDTELEYGKRKTITPIISEITKYLKLALKLANARNLKEYIPTYNVVSNFNKIK